jgi:hypothetical protein
MRLLILLELFAIVAISADAAKPDAIAQVTDAQLEHALVAARTGHRPLLRRAPSSQSLLTASRQMLSNGRKGKNDNASIRAMLSSGREVYGALSQACPLVPARG